jgi:hypothetical protein
MQAQDEGDWLAALQVARIIEEVRAPRLHLHDRALVDDHRARTFGVRAMQRRRCRTHRALNRDVLLRQRSRANEAHERAERNRYLLHDVPLLVLDQ